jgi:hypothetical protein
MNTETAFITATRNKLRIPSTKGTLFVEDLWDLSLEKLNEIAIQLDDILQKQTRKSFIAETPKENKEAELQFEIVKFVITTKLEEKKNKDAETKRAKEIEFLQKLLSKKEMEALENLSSEEIQNRIKQLTP